MKTENEDKQYYWVLNENNEPVPATVLEWGSSWESQNRQLWSTELGQVKIITMFHGYDHEYVLGQHDKPLLFGTIVKQGDSYRDEVLSETWMQAADAHQALATREAMRLACGKTELGREDDRRQPPDA